MPILQAMVERRADGVLENPKRPLTDKALLSVLGGTDTFAGTTVNEHSALKLAAVYACVRILSEGLATLPLPLYRRLERGKERAVDHPLYRILHQRPNPELSSVIFRELLEAHRQLWGNAYAEIVKNGMGNVVALWPLTPDRVTPRRRKMPSDKGNSRSGPIEYVVKLPGGAPDATLPGDRVLHISGLGWDGLRGYSPIQKAQQAIGAGLGAEEYGARWFPSGAKPAAVLHHPAKMSDEGYKRVREQFNREHEGLSRQHRVAILEEGMKLERWGVTADEAQFLEAQEWTVKQIARFYRVPLFKLGITNTSPRANAEQQDLEFLRDTLRPSLVRWEQEINYKLLLEEERSELFAEHLVDGLLRGDSEARHTAYANGRQWGYYSPNDVREMENLNAIDGGDVYHVPVNMVPMDEAMALSASTDGDDRAEKRHAALLASAEQRQQRSAMGRFRLHNAFVRLFLRAIERYVSQETKALERMLSKALVDGRLNLKAFLAALEEFYDDFPASIRRELQPVLIAFSEALSDEIRDEVAADPDTEIPTEGFAEDYLSVYTTRYTESSKGQVLKIIRESEDADTLHEEIGQRVSEWAETRAGKESRREAVRFGNGFAWAAFGALGVQVLRWMALGKSCPLCTKLDGKTVAITKPFLEKGETVDPEDGETVPLKTKTLIRHPPLHNGCDCVVTSG